MQNTKNVFVPAMAQCGNSTPNEAKTQRSSIDHSTSLSISALSPFEQLEARLNNWYDQKEQRKQQRLAQAQASPDQQYLYTTEENGYRYVYQVSIKLVNTVEIQPSLSDLSELERQALGQDTSLESEVCAYEC